MSRASADELLFICSKRSLAYLVNSEERGRAEL